MAAFDLADGKLRWVKQLSRPDARSRGAADFASPRRSCGRLAHRQCKSYLAGKSPASSTALDPDHGGETLWQSQSRRRRRTRRGGRGCFTGFPGVAGIPGGVDWGSAADHRNLYVAALRPFRLQPHDMPPGSLTALDMKTGAYALAYPFAAARAPLG